MIGFRVAIIHAIAGTFVPLFVIAIMTRFFGKNKSFREGLHIWKFALFAAFAMTIPYILVAYFLGPEFPALLGSLVGLTIVVTAARKGFFMPADETSWDFDDPDNWDPEWTGTLTIKDDHHEENPMDLWHAWLPYLLVGFLLVITRLKFLPFLGWLKAWTVGFPDMFGTDITARFQPLYLPGTVFIVVSLITFFIHKMNGRHYGEAWKRSFKTIIAASAALIFTVPMVQVFINSGGGAAGYAKMPIALADGVATLAGGAWPVFSPFIGGLGAFVAGSNTVSNMMFSLFQFGVGQRIGVDPTWIVALQAVGGAAGNMICVHNVVAASAVAGLVGKEGLVIRKTLVPFIYYALFTGSTGYAIVWCTQKGLLNGGTVIALAIVLLAVFLIRTNPKVSKTDSGLDGHAE